MTLDSTIPSAPSYILNYGCQVTVFPENSVNRIEVWRAPDNGSGLPNDGAATQCTVLPPSPLGGVGFIDPQPNDGAKRYYKSRHVDDAGNVSTFTLYSDGLIPVIITGAGAPNPMAAFGAIVDQLPPSSKYEMRFASTYSDPDALDGMQSFIDFAATTNFMRIGQAPLVVHASTSANPSLVTVVGHGLKNGNLVTIRGHLGNTAINSTFPVTVIDNDTFTVPVAGSGTGTADTGHMVKLSLTIDKNGNLKVFGDVQADTLTTTGTSTFNGNLSSLAQALFRTLQHSTVGTYGGIENFKRVMLDNNSVAAYGDVPASIDGDGDGTKLAGMIGTHSVNPSVITSRTTASQGTTAGWTDPDGSSGGTNHLSRTSAGSSTIAAASRLWCRVSTTLGSDVNPDAYDDQYKLTFRVKALATCDSGTTSAQTSVDIEVSIDGGSNWSTVSTGYTANADSSGSTVTATYSPTITVAGTLTQLRVRLKMSMTLTVAPGTVNPSGTADVLVFSSTWLTDTYPITWSTAVGGSYGRRGLKLPKMKQGQSLKNPGFELGSPNWVTYAGATAVIADPTKAHSGSNYIQVTTSGAAFGGAVQSDNAGLTMYFPVTPGDVITFGCWGYRESGTSLGHCVLNTYDSAFSLVTNVSGSTFSAAAWTQVSDTYTIPASGVSYVALFLEVNNVATTVARFDDTSLVIGTDDLPHAYLEPVDVAAADAKCIEGEVQYVGGAVHALQYRDDTKMRLIAKTLLAANAASITAIVKTVIATRTVPAGYLNTLGRVLRIRYAGVAGVNGGTVSIDVGGAQLATLTLTANQAFVFDYVLTTGATGASGRLDFGGFKCQATTFNSDQGNLSTLDLTGTLVINFNGQATTSGTTTLRIAYVAWESE